MIDDSTGEDWDEASFDEAYEKAMADLRLKYDAGEPLYTKQMIQEAFQQIKDWRSEPDESKKLQQMWVRGFDGRKIYFKLEFGRRGKMVGLVKDRKNGQAIEDVAELPVRDIFTERSEVVTRLSSLSQWLMSPQRRTTNPLPKYQLHE
jgi:hypothetical protein